MLTFEERKQLYADNFSLYFLNTDIGSKFAVISLICHITYTLKKKKPKATCLQVINKIIEKDSDKYDKEFIENLSIICEDFMKDTTEFLTFEIKSTKEMAKKVKEILDTYVPF